MKKEALKLADELQDYMTSLGWQTHQAPEMIRRLVEELDKVPEVVFDEGVYRWWLPNGDEFVIVPPSPKPVSDHLSQPLPNTLYVDETGKTSIFDGKQWKPLYQTKSLTDDELQKMWKGNVESCGWDSVIDFARAIEERILK